MLQMIWEQKMYRKVFSQDAKLLSTFQASCHKIVDRIFCRNAIASDKFIGYLGKLLIVDEPISRQCLPAAKASQRFIETFSHPKLTNYPNFTPQNKKVCQKSFFRLK